MSAQPFALASDLDGTFTAGTAQARTALRQAIESHPDSVLIYITGRTAESARALIRSEDLPRPVMLVSDVGTCVLRGVDEHVVDIERDIAASWPGFPEVNARLASVDGLEAQHIRAPYRASYWITSNRDLRRNGPDRDDFEARDPQDPSLSMFAAGTAADVALRARQALGDLDVDVLVSGNVYLDVLPAGVNKGSSLLRVLKMLNVAVEECIVAGDSLNDRALFEIGARGVVVGNCEPALRAAVGDRPGIYMARAAGAGGILEGLRHLGALPADGKGIGHGQ